MLAKQLRVTPAVLHGLLRDRSLLITGITLMGNEDFEAWIRKSDQTSAADLRAAQLVFQVRGPEERYKVEAYLDEFGVVPEYKNNRRLLVIDIARLVMLSAHQMLYGMILISGGIVQIHSVPDMSLIVRH